MERVLQILVTGSSRGLGRAMAEHLVQAGHRVLGCARSAATLEHPNYLHCQTDIVSEHDVTRLISATREHFGTLDVLINNAGTARMLPVALTPPATVRDILSVNFLGTYLVTHSAIRLMRKSTCGRIVNFTSVAVPLRLEGEAIYAAAKSAVETLTRVLARELGPMGITCNAIGPTPIRTDLIRNVPEEKLQALIARQPIPRWAEPSDVINLVEFLLRPESRMITGQVIYLGGIG